MSGVVVDFDFRKSKQKFVVEGAEARQSLAPLSHVSAKAFIMVSGAEINGSVRGSLADTSKKRMALIDFLLEAVEPIIRSVPPADLMEVCQIPQVDYTVGFDRLYKPEDRLYKTCIDVRYMRIRNEDDSLFMFVSRTD